MLKNKLFWAVVLLVGGLFALRFYVIHRNALSQLTFAQQLMGPPTVAVDVARKRDMKWDFDTIGTVQSRQSVNISAKTAGIILETPFEPGDSVRKGDILVKMDGGPAQANVLKKRSDLANARFTYYQLLAQKDMTITQASSGISIAQADLAVARAGEKTSEHVYKATAAQGKSQIYQAESHLVAAQADLRQAEVDFAKSKTHYERMLELRRQGFASLADSQDAYQEVLSKKAALDRQRAQLRASEADVSTAREQAHKEIASASGQIETSRFTAVSKQASLAEAQAGTARTAAFQQQLLAQESLVEAAKADLESAELQLRETLLISPLDGYVSERNSDPGTTASPGETILTVQSAGAPWIVTPLPQEVYGQVKVGQACTLTLDTPVAKSFPGHIVSIDPAIDAASRQFNVRVQLDEQQKMLKPGMFARVKLEVGMIRDVLAVPTAALFDRDEQKRTATVYKVVKHKVSAVKLNIGPSDDTHTLVGKGLSSGDLVVVQTAGDLTNGQEVKDQPAPGPTPEP